MKTKIENYIFNKTSKQITFSDTKFEDQGIRLDAVLLITNATDSTVIFNFADPTKGGTVSGNILTLTYDTSAMDDNDKLLIYYDDAEKIDLTADLIETLQELSQRLAPLASAMTAGNTQLRVTQLSVPSTAVTGPLTSAQLIAENNRLYLMQSHVTNINNVVSG